MSASDAPTSVAGFAAGQLRSLIERIERLNEEIDGLNQDKKEVYAEAKAHGFDPKIMRKVVGLRKKDSDEREEEESMVALYMSALGMLPADPSRVQVQAHAREAEPLHDPETGEILDDQATTAETEPQEAGAPLGDEADAPADNPGGADAVATETDKFDSTQNTDPTLTDDVSVIPPTDNEVEKTSPPESDSGEISGSSSSSEKTSCPQHEPDTAKAGEQQCDTLGVTSAGGEKPVTHSTESPTSPGAGQATAAAIIDPATAKASAEEADQASASGGAQDAGASAPPSISPGPHLQAGDGGSRSIPSTDEVPEDRGADHGQKPSHGQSEQAATSSVPADIVDLHPYDAGDRWPSDVEEGWEINPVTGEREAIMPAHLRREA